MSFLETLTSRLLCRRLFLLAPFVLAVVVYSASIPKDFTNWDDPKYILNNPLIQNLSFQNLYAILAQPYFGNYAPVTMLSYAVDVRLWGQNANAFHVHNVLLHLAALVVLYVLLGQLGLGPWPRYLAVLAFAVHPTNVESVSWASERKNLLSALFFLLCLSQYVAYTRQKDRRPYLLSVLFFALSVLSKAGTVLTPLILLALDYFWEQKRVRDIRLADKIPFFLVGAGAVYLSLYAASRGGALYSYGETPVWLKVLDSGRLITEYLRLVFWPVHLTPLITPKLLPSLSDPRVFLPFLLVGSILVFWIRYWKRSFFWIAFFLLLLAPVMNVVPLPVVMSCRYLYLPQIGVWVLLGILLGKLNEPGRVRWRYALWVVVLVSIALLTVRARSWAADWRNSITLWESVAREDPGNLVARANLGQAYQEKQRNQEAILEFQAILRIQPDNVLALTGLANCALGAGDFKAAEAYATKATRASPEYALAFRMLGRSQLLQKDLANARNSLVRAYELSPSDNGILDDLVSVYQSSTQPLDGTPFTDLMIQNSPDTFEGYWARARLLLTGGRYAEAVPFLEAAAIRLQRAGQPPDSRIVQALAFAKSKTSPAGRP